MCKPGQLLAEIARNAVDSDRDHDWQASFRAEIAKWTPNFPLQPLKDLVSVFHFICKGFFERRAFQDDYITDELVRPNLGSNLGEGFLQFMSRFPRLIPQAHEPTKIFMFSNENNFLELWFRGGLAEAVANYAQRVSNCYILGGCISFCFRFERLDMTIVDCGTRAKYIRPL